MKKTAKESRKPARQLQQDDSFRKIHWIQLGLILLGVFIVYSPTFAKEFINYDDDWYIYNNPLLSPFRFNGIGKIFTEFYFGQYSPIPMTFLGILSVLSNHKPFIYNLSAVLLHLINICLVCWLTYRLFRKPMPALIVSALFGVCSMNVESVAWASAAFKTGFYSAFYLSSLIAYTFYLTTERSKYFAACLVLFVLSFLSKEQAVALVLSLLCIDYLQGRNLFCRKVILEKLPFLLLSLVFGLVTLMATRSNREAFTFSHFTLPERFLYACYALGEYAVKSVVPYRLCAYYPYPAPGKFSFWFYLHPFIIAGLIFLVVRSWHKRRAIAFGICFFIANLLFSLALQVVSVREVVMADRYVYVSSIGLFFVFGFVVQRFIVTNPQFRPSTYSILLLYILAVSAVSFERSKVWRNTKVLLEDNLKHFISPLPLVNLGIEYKREGQIERAMANYNRAIELYPDYGLAYLNRGNIYFDAQRIDLAMADYNQAETLGIKTEHLYANRGGLYAMKRNYERAFTDFEKSLNVNPRHANAFLNRSITYMELKDFTNAIADCTSYLQLKPDDADMYCNRGVAYQNLDQHDNALRDFDMAIRLQPKAGIYYLNRSYSYNRLGKKELALIDAATAQRLGVKVDSQYLEQLGTR